MDGPTRRNLELEQSLSGHDDLTLAGVMLGVGLLYGLLWIGQPLMMYKFGLYIAIGGLTTYEIGLAPLGHYTPNHLRYANPARLSSILVTGQRDRNLSQA